MITTGVLKTSENSYGVILEHKKKEVELLITLDGNIYSAYKSDKTGEYSFLNNDAKNIYRVIKSGIAGCKAKNGSAIPFALGTSVRHEFSKNKTEYAVELYDSEVSGLYISNEDMFINTSYSERTDLIPDNIPYIKLSSAAKTSEFKETDNDGIVVRTVSEIALDKKDISWLRNKKYYIVNDDETAEKIFTFLDDYNGVISYDTETSGLKINCFSKINSQYSRDLEKWNAEHPDEQIRADYLVGIIFCIEDDVSYYFPARNRKFKNLYEDVNSSTRIDTINKIKNRYLLGDMKDVDGDMADYVRNTPASEWRTDVVLMERCRGIIESRHLTAHNASFEYKVGLCYDLDTNIKDDTMILHQLMYKFRGTKSNRGESSKLKELAYREFGIEQWELDDFFPDYAEDDSGLVRSTKKKSKKVNSKIDFSYMDYDGTRVYAPTDGDIGYKLLMKYKTDMLTNHKEQEYIYNVEVIVSCAIGYMEFYGHRLAEEKINSVRDKLLADMNILESEIRQIINYSSNKEIDMHRELKELVREYTEKEKEYSEEERKEIIESINAKSKELKNEIDNNVDYTLNLASPAQVAKLFYDDLKIPFTGEKKSVAKKVIKSLLKNKDEDGNNKYPIVHLYSEYKKIDTLLTKFFDNLQYYMYPGGYVFSSYGQIDTATGRMSCRKPNAQQYPKDITEIVIPRDGFTMLDADFSQIEYRVLVALAGEDRLAELFKDPDNDYHTIMASRMYGVPYASVTPKMRGDAKSFNFGIPYGMGFKSLAILLTGMSGRAQIEEAKVKYELYFKDQPKIRKFFDNIKEMALINKHTKTFWNRYRYYNIDTEGGADSYKKAAALRQAGNAVIQGTAADIFKIAIARIFSYIRQHKLFGKLLITNMIHDEVLCEFKSDSLNVLRVLKDIGDLMQFKVNGFPPLFIGAGIGESWSLAKGKMAEIHPHLLAKISEEADSINLFEPELKTSKEIVEYMNSRVYEFRRNKVIEYILDEENHNKELHPVIGNLLNLQFNYGHSKDGEHLSDDEYTKLCLSEFIKNNNLNVDAELFKGQANKAEDIEEEEYDDVENNDDVDDIEYYESDFSVIDETNIVYGTSVQELISIFGYVVSKKLRICGIDTRVLGSKKKEALIDFLYKHICDAEEEGSMQIVFLHASGILNETGIYIKGVEGSDVETRIKMMDMAI